MDYFDIQDNPDNYYKITIRKTLKSGEEKEYTVYRPKKRVDNPKKRGPKKKLKTRLIEYIRGLNDSEVKSLCESINLNLESVLMGCESKTQQDHLKDNKHIIY